MNAKIRLCWVLFLGWGIWGSVGTESGLARSAVIGGKYPDMNGYETQPGVVGMEFIYEKAPYPECHASTIAEGSDGLVAAWFGGTKEGHPDVGIWVSRLTEEGWNEAVEVADGVQGPQVRYPCWNPVLFQTAEGPLMLFYKVGPDPRTWQGVKRISEDGGKSWSNWRLLPEDCYGPIKNKPIELPGGVLLCPSSTEDHGWRVHFEKYQYREGRWRKIGPINDGKKFGAIEPTILRVNDAASGPRLLALSRSKQDVITQAWSSDEGETWSAMSATSLPNPNSGFDAVTLRDGRHLLVYNHTVRQRTGEEACGREMLNVAISRDGVYWTGVLVLEKARDAEFSYPAVIQTADGLVHVTYTWKRQRIKHVVIDPGALEATKF